MKVRSSESANWSSVMVTALHVWRAVLNAVRKQKDTVNVEVFHSEFVN